MSEELVMPRLSDTMEEGTIGRWLVHEGDAFAAGDVLAEIETDKATMEFQAYDAGTVLRILVGDGETVALGAPIAIVGAEGETADEAASAGNGGTTQPPQEEAAAEPEPEPKAAPARKPSKSSSKAKAAAGNGSRAAVALRVSPIARRMADEAGIDLAAMAGRGSGPEGRVVKADVERLISSGELTRPAAADASPAAESAPAEGEIRELTPMLKAVATRMTQSKQAVPHFYVESEIDMTRAMQLRAELNGGLADSGGLMIASKLATSNMPRLETEKVAPSISRCLSLPARARPARSRVSRLISRTGLVSASFSTGTIRPSSRATAMPMLACVW